MISQTIKQSQLHSSPHLLYLGNKSTYDVYFHQAYQMKFEKYIIKVSPNDLNHYINIYQWRSKTTFPVVKTYSHNIIQSNNQQIVIEVYNEHCQVKLCHLYQIPFNQLLYIIKQSMFGFQRLSNKFGRFNVTSKMIGINERRQCKVWINQCYEYNNTTPNTYTEKVMKERSKETSQSRQFFNIAITNLSFLALFTFIDQFIYIHKIKIPKKFSFISNVHSSYLKNKLEVYKSLSKRSAKSSKCSKITSNYQHNQQLSHQFNLSVIHQYHSSNNSHTPFHTIHNSLINNLEVIESHINDKQLLHKGSQGNIAIKINKHPTYSSQNAQSIIESIKEYQYNKYQNQHQLSKYGWQLTVDNIFESNCDINKSMEVDDQIEPNDNTIYQN